MTNKLFRSAVLLISLLAAVAASTLVHAQPTGSWTGTISQPGYPPYQTRITLNGSRGTVEYAGLKCQGELSLIGEDNGTFAYRERITQGPCANGGTLRLRSRGSALDWAYSGHGQEFKATLALVPSSSSSAVQTKWTVTARGVGPIRLGMTATQAAHAVQRKFTERSLEGGGQVEYRSSGLDVILYGCETKSAVIGSVVVGSRFSTELGVRVGDHVSAFERLYGKTARESWRNEYAVHYVVADSSDPTFVLGFTAGTAKHFQESARDRIIAINASWTDQKRCGALG